MEKNPLSQRIDERLKKLWAFLASCGKRPARGEVRGLFLGDEPRAFAIWDYVFEGMPKNRPDFWERLRDKPLLVVIMRTWETGALAELEPWVRLVAGHKQNFPRHRVAFAANTEAEERVFAAAGLDAVWCNHNALVNEKLFQPVPDAKAGDEREFDAIYDARLARYKRHHLAAGVRSLALIHYTAPNLFEALWTLKMRWMLRHARILNRHRWKIWPVWLGQPQVAAAYNRSRVGLCLSAVEGAMLASIQYLLCGLPVVTTPNRGGRDDFFDEENSIEVAAEPEAVAAGVRTLIERRVDPWVIREKTRVRMAEHRARLVALVEEFQRAHGVTGDRLLSQAQPPRMRNGFSDKLG